MNKTLRNTVMAGWMMAGAWGTMSQAKTSDPAGAGRNVMIVYVYDYAHQDPRILLKAETIAAAVFEQAGIQAIVVDDGAATEDPTMVPSASSIPRITVSILTPERARPLGLACNVLGGAPGQPTDANRNLVYIVDHVANKLAEQQPNVGKARILGHAIAHEIGHLLLNMTGHSETGLMKADWKPEDMQSMTLGQLTFDAAQIARIQAEVLRRARQRQQSK